MKQFDELTLNEYLDGTLDAATRQQVEQWLAESAEAQAMLADLQHTFTALAALDDLPLTRDLAAAVVAQIETEETAVTPAWMYLLLGGQLLAIMGMIIAIWPDIQIRLNSSRTILLTLMTQVSWPEFAIGSRLAAWGTAAWEQLQFNPPTLDLAAGQWGLLLSLAFLAWLAGNRLLFSEDTH